MQTNSTMIKNPTKSNKNVAIYLNSDILSLKETRFIKNILTTYNFLNILMDRKADPISNRRYTMSFTERCDILVKEMKLNKITEYQIWPIDETIQSSVGEFGIQEIIFDFDSEFNNNFLTSRKIKALCENVEILYMKTEEEQNVLTISDIFKFDKERKVQKKMYSDYTFSKYRLRNIKKIGLLGDNEKTTKIMKGILADRGYKILDMDDLKEDKQKTLGNFLINNFDKTMFLKVKNESEFPKSFLTKRIYMESEGKLLEESIDRRRYDLVIPSMDETKTRNFIIERMFMKGKVK